MNVRDTIEALPDALLARWGTPSRLAHPLAADLAENPLSKACEAAGDAAYIARNVLPTALARSQVLAAGMLRSDFKNAIADAVRKLAMMSYADSAEHLAMCADMEVKNFLPVEFPGADVDLTLDEITELGERKSTRLVDVAGVRSRLVSYGRDVLVSRETVVNDDVAMLGASFLSLGTSASRLEAQLVAELLESNPTLGDGLPMFSAANIVGQPIGATELGAAMAILRTQTTAAGNLANNRPAVLTVAADVELPARTILKDAGLELSVVVLPWLPAGRWYLQASPKVAPTVGRLVLKGAEKTRPLTVGLGKTQVGTDGFFVAALADLGVVPLSRIGIVRGGA